MRLSPLPVSVLLGLLVAGCEAEAPTAPERSTSTASALSADAPDPRCTLALHAILRETGSEVTVGQVQFRVHPPEPGSSEATVEYRGVYGPTGGSAVAVLGVALRSRAPDQAPTWSDSDKTGPGGTLPSVAHFGRTAPMDLAMALALVDDPSRYRAIVNVATTTGGREAEGLVGPRTEVPESLRERQRLCFGGD